MHIEHLEAYHFRNLERFSLDLGPGVVVFEGANAQGKTNLLEAMYVCATGKSFRRARPRELLRHDQERGWLRARFSRQGVRHDVAISLEPQRRVIEVDGRLLRRASRLLEIINIVAFFPDDLRIVKGSPDERRNFLDRAVANHRQEFVEATLRYLKALKTRNLLLRDKALNRAVLAAYDEQLVEYGTTLYRDRVEVLARLRPAVERYFTRIMQVDAEVGLKLLSGLQGASAGPERDPEPTPDAFRAALAQSYRRDRMRGSTQVGPHRSDLEISIDGMPARRFASQGQQRALVLALKLAEAEYLEQALDSAPCLLLDDVSSELDAERTRMLFTVVAELRCQVWVTTTRSSLLPLSSRDQILTVRAGNIFPATE